MGWCCWDAEGLEAGSLDGWTVSKSTERKYGQVMDGMEEVRERKFRGSRLNGLGGAGKTSSCQQRAKVGGGLLRSSRPDAPSSQCEEELALPAPGAGCEGPSLTIAAGSRNSLPTPRRVALSVAYRPVSRFVTSFNNYGQNVRGPRSPPQPTLRDFLASALPHGNPPVPSPPTLPLDYLLTVGILWPPLAPSGRSVGVVDASNRSRRNLSDT